MIEPETPPSAADCGTEMIIKNISDLFCTDSIIVSRSHDMVATDINPLFPGPGAPKSPMGDFMTIQTNPSCLQIPSDFLKSTVCRLLCEVTAQWATKHPFIDYCTARGADLVMVLNEGAGGVTTRRIARLACL